MRVNFVRCLSLLALLMVSFGLLSASHADDGFDQSGTGGLYHPKHPKPPKPGPGPGPGWPGPQPQPLPPVYPPYPPPYQPPQQPTVQFMQLNCMSFNLQPKYCPVPNGYTIQSAYIIEAYQSDAYCVQNYNYYITANGISVMGNCRARFGVYVFNPFGNSYPH